LPIDKKEKDRMTDFIADAWYVGALSHEVQGDALFARRLLDRPVLFYRRQDGAPVALLDRCPHRFAYLSKGTADRRRGGVHLSRPALRT
jgi:phenylpropionate dioxygenase-like ring-hydroxylating dioxygenase large terminal subunit